MAHDVFICHSSRDKQVADAVCATLEAQGVVCWIAPRDINAGVSYAEAIVTAITNAKVMVLIFSATANKSQQVEREIERAVHHNVPLIPLRIEDVAPERALEYFLATPHWLDAYTPPMEPHLARLATQVSALLGRTPPASPPQPASPASPPYAAAAPPPTPPHRSNNTLVLVAGGVVALSVLVLAAVIFVKPFGGAPASVAPANAAIAAPASPTAPAAPTPQVAAAPTTSPPLQDVPAVAPGPGPICRVADPTPTPLNIRDRPGGDITGTIDNGERVRVTDHASGVEGRAWVLIDPVSGSPKAGWVFASFLDCPGGDAGDVAPGDVRPAHPAFPLRDRGGRP